MTDSGQKWAPESEPQTEIEDRHLHYKDMSY